MAEPSEAQLHKSVVQYLAYALPRDAVVIHIPNEGKRGWKSQAALKHTGVLKGAPDLLICWQGVVTFIELKSATGRVSPDQKTVHERLRVTGFRAFICRSLDEVHGALTVVAIPLKQMAGIPSARAP